MLSKTQFNSLCCYSADRNADCDTTDMFCSIKQHYMIRFILQTFLPAQLKCMRQESVMCKKKKKNGAGGFMHCTQLLSCPLLDAIGGSCSGFDLQFCREIEEESGSCYRPWRSLAVVRRLLTLARSTFEDNVIDGNVTPHWWTPDRFKHNLEQTQRGKPLALSQLLTAFQILLSVKLY